MTAVGIDRRTGKVLVGWPHVAQSVQDIFTTRLMTRVMRRDYGSEHLNLVDQPMTDRTLMQFASAANDALDRWEPRFRLTHVEFQAASADGVAEVVCDGIYYPRGHLGDFSVAETVTGFQVRLGA